MLTPNKSSEKLYNSQTDLLQRKRKLSLEKLELNVPVVPREKLQISSFLLASGGTHKKRKVSRNRCSDKKLSANKRIIPGTWRNATS